MKGKREGGKEGGEKDKERKGRRGDWRERERGLQLAQAQ